MPYRTFDLTIIKNTNIAKREGKMIRETTIKYDYPIVAICSYLLMTI